MSLATVSWIVSRARWRFVGFVAAGMFVLLYGWAAVVTIRGALSDFRWGFHVLFLRECSTAAALIVGIYQVITSGVRRMKP